MPRRTVTVTRLWAAPRGNPDDPQDLTRLGGTHDILHVARAFFRAMPRSQLVDHEKERYVEIENLTPAGRILLLELSAGHFGDTGPTRDVLTGQTTYVRKVHESSAAAVRAMLALPERSTSLLIFLEHSQGASASWALIEPLRKFLRHRYGDFTWRSEGLVVPGAWQEAAELTEVSAVLHGHSPNIEDNDIPKVVGKLRHVLTPERGNRIFPRQFKDAVVSGGVNRGELFGVDDTEVGDVYLQMMKDGRRKRFALGAVGAPLARWVLSDSGEAEPGTDAAVDFFVDMAPDLFTAVGADWQSDDRYGAWPDEALALEVEVPM